MEDIKESIKALKNALGVEKDSELSEALEISYSAIDAWKRRGKLPDKYEKYIHNVTGNGNISFSGSGNTVSGNNTASSSQATNYNEEIKEVFDLLQEYGSPKMIKELKDRLLQIKALHG